MGWPTAKISPANSASVLIRIKQSNRFRRKMASASSEAKPVAHDETKQRFECDGAFCQYEIQEVTGNIDIIKTSSPPEKRGQGLAGRVVEQAFAFAKDKGVKIVPTCSYVPHFVKKNSQWKDYMVVEKSSS